MPSYKPRITVYTDENTSKKISYIAKKENRSASNLTEYLIKKAIMEYEKENGEIKIEDSTPESIKDMLKKSVETMKDPNLSITEKIAGSYNHGAKYGDKLGEEFVESWKKKK